MRGFGANPRKECKAAYPQRTSGKRVKSCQTQTLRLKQEIAAGTCDVEIYLRTLRRPKPGAL